MCGEKTKSESKQMNVKSSEFAKDPKKYMQYARDGNTVTITDSEGKPRMLLVVSKPIEEPKT